MLRSRRMSATGKLVSPARFTSSIAASNSVSRASASAGSSRPASPATSWPRSSSMSSMFMATSISSSTTRTRRRCSATRTLLRPKRVQRGKDRAAQAVALERQVGGAAEVGTQPLLDQARAEAASGRPLHRRAALLLPDDAQPPVLVAPGNRYPSLIGGKSPIFGRVGGKLVQGQRQRQRRARRQPERIAVEVEPPLVAAEGRRGIADDPVERRSAPILLGE